MDGIDLLRITDSNYGLIQNLVAESKQEGFEFVQRTIDDWNSGANRFSRDGEGFWGLLAGDELIGIGGLNIDPYTNDSATGRVRHLYIHPAWRRQGRASLLMTTIIEQARLHFHTLRLFTTNPATAAFYGKLGFQHLSGHKLSHVLILTR
ncbi:MAG TPA: GNAT family N-acetyltransferase [Puia sp.]|nr:GNAT family N-acetyltransferase [Puia sp.]